ncbi:hypothetical protein NPIL_548061 [Nephila pilipes]|uniref:Uncharacterized protein n=1 Tax=Nephila pilipes TaxID=299642 RepID=A0A8X6U2Q3_NEPPI|nr:hypothetical protein NPIL_548061 [Nephila pilipes]
MPVRVCFSSAHPSPGSSPVAPFCSPSGHPLLPFIIPSLYSPSFKRWGKEPQLASDLGRSSFIWVLINFESKLLKSRAPKREFRSKSQSCKRPSHGNQPEFLTINKGYRSSAVI